MGSSIERSAATQSAAAPPADERRWLALVFIAAAQLMIALDATVVNIAMPSAQAALGFSDADRQWIVTAYTLAFGGLLLLGGRLADSVRLGRRRAFLIGLVGFAAASALSGAAVNLPMLIVARAIQGACAALLAPTALSLLAVMFTAPDERGRAFGIYGAIAASGGAVGLLLGGALTEYLDWRWCLYVNVPIALAAALGGRATLRIRTHQQPAATTHFDALGLLLGSSGLVAIVAGFGQAAARGWAAPLVLALLLGGATLLGLFVWREASVDAPLLPLRIVVDPRRSAAYLSALFAIAGMFGAFLFLTYEFQVVMGFSPLQAGFAFLPMSAASFVAATLLAARLRMVPGFVLGAAGMLLLSQLHIDSSYVLGILPAELLLGIGTACVMVSAARLATAGVSFRDAGIASAALNSAQQIGASLGTSILNSVAAGATAAYVIANASGARTDALVHGYATAALCGALLLLAGGVIAFLITNRRVVANAIS